MYSFAAPTFHEAFLFALRQTLSIMRDAELSRAREPRQSIAHSLKQDVDRHIG